MPHLQSGKREKADMIFPAPREIGFTMPQPDFSSGSMRGIKLRLVNCLLYPIFILCGGCYLVSDEVVGGAQAIFNDEKLPGLWRAEGKPGFFLILGRKESVLSFHFMDENFVADAEFYAGNATNVGGETFLNVKRYTNPGEKSPETGYIPAHYKLTGNRLTIAIFNTIPFDNAIKEKLLQGKASVKGTYSSTTTQLSGTGAAVAKFMLTHLKQPDFLDKPVVFERLQPPAAMGDKP